MMLKPKNLKISVRVHGKVDTTYLIDGIPASGYLTISEILFRNGYHSLAIHLLDHAMETFQEDQFLKNG